VKSLVIFLNELSFTTANTMTPQQMLPHVLSTLKAVRDAKKVRNDIVIAGQPALASVLLGAGAHPLAAILNGDDHREEWRFLRSLAQSSPWGAYPHSERPGEFHEVSYQGQVAIGMLWAKQNDSTILSFAFPPNWSTVHVDAQFHEMDGAGDITSAEVAIPNLSMPEHVTAHRVLLENYGRTMSESSLVYDGDGFVVRMFFNDHPPPHFHVLMRRNTSETLARYAIETLDLLSGNLPSAVRKQVIEWAEENKGFLMNNWERCRAGQHPFLLQE
jgi:hypothetical protein